jgi:hypothetical protein
MLLGATIALQEKNYRETQEIIARFNQVVPAVFLQAQRLAGYEAAALFDLGFSVRTGGALTPPLGAGRTLLLLTDVPVARRFAELDELSREEATLNALGEDWKNRNDDAPSQLYDRRGVAAFELGELLQRRLQRLVESLAEQIGEANHIEFEALQLEKASLKRWW